MNAPLFSAQNQQQRSRTTQGTGSYAVRLRPLRKAKREEPQMSEETRKTFEAISDPANAHLFTVKAALKAFKRVKS